MLGGVSFFTFFFFALLVYLRHFPLQLLNFYVWIWIANILWFDLDLTSTKTDFLVRLLHGPALVGSCLSAIAVCFQLRSDQSYLNERIQAAGTPLMAWFLITWINFLPPVWHLIDLYLHREDLIERHNLRIPLQTFRPIKLCRVSLQVLWLITSTPILGAIFILNAYYTQSLSAIFFLYQNLIAIFFIVIIASNLMCVLVLVLIVRRVKGKKKVIDQTNDNYEHSRSGYHHPSSVSVTKVVDDDDSRNVVVGTDKNNSRFFHGTHGTQHSGSTLPSHLF